MTASDIGESARIAYAAGVDPVGYAEHEVTLLITAHFAAAVRAASDPGPRPDLSTAAMSRRILGLLLNAGWTTPAADNPPEEP